MKIVFMGTPDFSVPALQALVAAGHDVVAVYSQPPRPAGRGKKDRPSAVHLAALELGLDVFHPVNFKDASDREQFAAHGADVAVVVAYGLILPQDMLDAPKHGCLNIHASLLPRWRGAAPIHRAIMAGDTETGVCIMQMEAGLDTGPVLSRCETAIGATETTAILHDRLAAMGADVVVAVLNQLPLQAMVQPDDGVTYAAKITKDEARIDWDQPAQNVSRMIRGLSPFPGAWCMAGEERLKVLNARVVDGQGASGDVFDGTRVACKSGAVEMTMLQPAGKKAQTADVFLTGRALPVKLT